MKKINRLIKIGIVFAVVMFLAMPAGLIQQKTMAAVSQESAIENTTEKEQPKVKKKYDLVIIEDEAVPLAPAPEKNYSLPVAWVVAIAVIAVVLSIYTVWYLAYKKRISALLTRLPKEQAERMGQFISFLHPIYVMQAEHEIENELASAFISE